MTLADRLAAGRAARTAGDLAAAAAHFRAAVLARPGHVAARLDLAHALLKLGEATAAADLAAAVVADAPTNPLAHLRLGEARRALGDADGARGAFAAAVAADPGHARAGAEHAAAQRRPDAAASTPQQADAPTHRHPAAAWFAATEAAIRTGRLVDADALLATPPAAAGSAAALPHLARARLLAARWQPAAALREHGAALAADPDRRRHALERAGLALLALDPLAAREALRAAGDAATASRPAALLEEAAIDPGILARLVALRPLPPPDRVAPLRALVVAAPETTLVAAALLLALRCAGAFATPPAPAVEAPRCATFAPAGAFTGWSGGLAWSVFDDAAAAQFLAARGLRDVVAAFAMADPPRRRDLFRLAWLHAEGGLWVDAGGRPGPDTAWPPASSPASSPAWSPARSVLAVRLEPGALLGTAWLAAAPGEAVIARALAAATRSVLEGARDPPWLATGTGLLTRAFATAFAAAPDAAAWLAERAIVDWHALPMPPRAAMPLPPPAAIPPTPPAAIPPTPPAGPLAPGGRIVLDLPDLAALA